MPYVALVLLRHKRRKCGGFCMNEWQHGHRYSDLARATVSRFRRVAIEFSTWRSGRIGGASGSWTTGKDSALEPPGS